MERTTISVTTEMADELHSRKNRGDSYEDVIRRLIERADKSMTPDDRATLLRHIEATQTAAERGEREELQYRLEQMAEELGGEDDEE